MLQSMQLELTASKMPCIKITGMISKLLADATGRTILSQHTQALGVLLGNSG